MTLIQPHDCRMCDGSGYVETAEVVRHGMWAGALEATGHEECPECAFRKEREEEEAERRAYLAYLSTLPEAQVAR